MYNVLYNKYHSESFRCVLESVLKHILDDSYRYTYCLWDFLIRKLSSNIVFFFNRIVICHYPQAWIIIKWFIPWCSSKKQCIQIQVNIVYSTLPLSLSLHILYSQSLIFLQSRRFSSIFSLNQNAISIFSSFSDPITIEKLGFSCYIWVRKNLFLFCFFSREKWEKQVSRRWSTALLPVVRWFWQSIRNSPAISPPLPVNVSRSFLLPIIDSRTIAMVIPLIILLIVDSVRPASSFHFRSCSAAPFLWIFSSIPNLFSREVEGLII